MAEPDDHEVARRVRAAVGYSGKAAKDIAAELKVKPASFRNYMSPSRPTRADLELRYRIADCCDIPRWFMEDGFSRPEIDDGLQETLRRIQDRLGELEIWRAARELEAPAQPAREGSGDPPAPRKLQP